MSPPQRTIFLALCVAIALTRFAPVAPALFDWDEAQFVSAVREYDVTQRHPDPPGYPLFVLLTKLVHLGGADTFRALQSVVVVGAVLLFPALFWLARELGFDFATASSGAAIFAFLPNLWPYGGTAFSDVPATAIAFAACALLLRGRRDARAYLCGAIVLAIARSHRAARHRWLTVAVFAPLATGIARAEPLYVHGSMRPHAGALLRDRDVRFWVDYDAIPRRAWVIDQRVHPGATNFVRERDGTWRVLRRRNFEAAVLRK